jgi:hypothetical protein
MQGNAALKKVRYDRLPTIMKTAFLFLVLVGISCPTFAQTSGANTGTAATSGLGIGTTGGEGSPSPSVTSVGPNAPGAGAAAGTAANHTPTTGNMTLGVVTTTSNTPQTGSVLLKGANGRSVFNISQTITASFASSSDLQIAARNVEIDQRRSDQAAAAGRPNVTANAQATRFDQATLISLGGSPPIEVLPNHTELLSINLADRLDITGQIRAASDQAHLQSLSDQFTLEYVRDQRILRAKTIYFNLLRAEHQVLVAQSTLTTAQRQLRDAQNLNAAQVGQKIDVYRAATQVANAQQQLTASLNNRDIARENFNDLVGRPLSAPVQVEDVPGVNIGTDVTNTSSVGAQSPLDFTPFVVVPDEISEINLDQSLNLA